ncbi:MAG: hypothetical protein QOJ99_4417 [Bryobacterales bacterium]|nr:hypothetical protein [Bryobacterales bacterium]
MNNTVLGQSAYSRTGSRNTTNSNDMVYQVANKERMLATVSGDIGNGYTAALTAGVSLTVAPAAAPVISQGGVANAVSGVAGLAPGSWISIYGSSLSTSTRALAAADLVNNTIPTSLSGVTVQINGKAAYMGYVSATQLNVPAPADTGAGTVTVVVTNAAGTSNSAASTSQTVLPGLSTAANYVRAVRYPDGAIVNGTSAAETGFTSSAAIGQGDILALYGTGFGPTYSDVPTGIVSTGAYPTTNQVTVTVGGVPAEVLWSGLVGAGLYQINVRVPASLPDGDQPVIASVSGLNTQSGALLKVAASVRLAARSAPLPLHNALCNGMSAGRFMLFAGLTGMQR